MSRDFRLWPLATAAWCSTAVVVSSSASWQWVLSGSGVVVVLLAVVVITRSRRRRAALRSGPHPVLLALVVALLAALIAAVRLTPVLASTDLPHPGDVVTVVGVVDGDPRLVDGPVVGVHRMASRLVVALTVEQWGAHDHAVAAHLPVSLWAPPTSTPLLPGTRIEGVASVGPGDAAAGTAFSLTMRRAPTIIGEPPWWQIAAAHIRDGLREAVRGLPADGAALLPGFVLGDTSTMPADLATDMRTAGLTHLVVVSGTNVSAILAGVLGFAAVLRLRARSTVVLAAVALVAFVILVRPSPSVVRAAAMGSVVIVSLIAGGRRAAPPALAGAVLVLVLADPWLAVSLGFALSVAATAGLIVIAPILRDAVVRRIPRAPPRIIEALAVATAAQLATAPLLIAEGLSVGIGSVPANLAAEAAVSPTTVLGVLAAVAAPVSPAVAHVIAVPAVWGAEWVARVARLTARYAGTPLPLPTGVLGALAVVGCVGVIATFWFRRDAGLGPHLRRVRAPLAVAVACVVIAVATLPRVKASAQGWPPPGWVAVACDVGQGDAIVIRVDDESAVVVDAGPEPSAVDRCLTDLGIRHVPAVLLTHFHADHVEGLPGVLRGRDVGQVLVSPLPEPADEAARVASWCAQRHIVITPVSAGDSRGIGDVTWHVVWPRRIIRGQGSDPNNASVTAVVTVEGVRLLLGGDVEPAAQDAIMAAVSAVGVDVIKVPHHGSRKQSPLFAAWSGARAAIISVGAHNDYGHPSPQTIASYRARGIAVWRTDLDGDVAVLRLADSVGVVGRQSPHP